MPRAASAAAGSGFGCTLDATPRMPRGCRSSWSPNADATDPNAALTPLRAPPSATVCSMDASEVVSVVAEVIGWIALGGGLVCLLLALLIRLADGRWLPTEAVVIDQEHGATIRWFAEGAFHQRRLSDEERVHVRHPEEEPAYFKEREPDRLRLHESPPGRRIIRNVGLILIGIAVVAGIVGVVLMFTA